MRGALNAKNLHIELKTTKQVVWKPASIWISSCIQVVKHTFSYLMRLLVHFDIPTNFGAISHIAKRVKSESLNIFTYCQIGAISLVYKRLWKY